MIKVTRADQQFLDLAAPREPSQDHDFPLERVVVQPAALIALQRRLYIPGSWSGGPLYGDVRAGTLTVRLAGAAGPLGWRQGGDPLALDEGYVQGYSDAVQMLGNGRTDWAGYWLMGPTRQFPDKVTQLRWLDRAYERGLMDTDHPLLFAGWRAGVMGCVTACAEQAGIWTWLALEAGPGGQPEAE